MRTQKQSAWVSNIRGWNVCAPFTLNLHVYSSRGMSSVARCRQSPARAALLAATAALGPVPQSDHSAYHLLWRPRWGAPRTQNSVHIESSLKSRSLQIEFPYSVTVFRRNIHYSTFILIPFSQLQSMYFFHPVTAQRMFQPHKLSKSFYFMYIALKVLVIFLQALFFLRLWSELEIPTVFYRNKNKLRRYKD